MTRSVQAVLVSLILFCFFPVSVFAGKGLPQRPNILIITADNLGYGDLKCYNPASPIYTPNLNRLSAQGARLTAWELAEDGLPVTVITDSMVAHCMKEGRIGAVVVGADRIAKNGDVANKIGTYGVAQLAKAHGIPFYVAAPWSTVDLDMADGSTIPIEQRARGELAVVGGRTVVPDGVPVYNPAFDVTPAALVTKIVTERGIHEPSELAAAARG